MKKNTLKGWIPTTGMILVLAFGATVANAGETQGRPSNTCTAAAKCEKVDKGIFDTIKAIISDFTGILVTD